MSRVEVQVGVRNAAFRSGLEQMRSSAKKFSADIKSMFIGAFAAGAIVAGLRSVLEKGDEIGDLAQRFRISAEELQRLGFAGQATGTSMEAVARGIEKLRIAQADAVEKNGEARRAFAQMGVTLEELRRMPTEELFQRTANAVQAAGSETEKLSIATAVFGNRIAGELIPLLNLGGAKIRELGGSAGVMSEETVAALGAAKDEIERIQQTLTVAVGWLMANVLNPIINIAKSLGVQYAVYFTAAASVVGRFAQVLTAALSGRWSEAIQGVRNFGRSFRDEMAASLRAARQELQDIWKDPTQPKGEEGPAQAGSGSGPDPDLLKAEQELAAERERNARAAMDRQQRINALQEDYNRLLAEAANLTGAEQLRKLTEAERVKGRIEAEERTQESERTKLAEQIEAERRKQEEAGQTRAQRIESLREQVAAARALVGANDGRSREEQELAVLKLEGRLGTELRAEDEELLRAREAEAEVDERNKLAGMSKSQRRDYFQSRQQALLAEAAAAEGSGDSLTATRKRTEAKRLESELRDEAKDPSASAFTVDALSRVGGGGNLGSFSDPVLREQERQTSLLQRIAEAVEERPQTAGPTTATLGP